MAALAARPANQQRAPLWRPRHSALPLRVLRQWETEARGVGVAGAPRQPMGARASRGRERPYRAGDGGGGVKGPRHVVLAQRRVPAGHRQPGVPRAAPARRPPPPHPPELPLRPLPPPLGLPLLRLARRPRRRLAGRRVPPAGAPRLGAVRGGAGGAARSTGPRRPARPRAARCPHAQRAQGDAARLPMGPPGDRVPRQAAPQEPQDGAGRPRAPGGAARGLCERRVPVLPLPALAERAPAVRVGERRPLLSWRAAHGPGARGETPAQECPGVACGTENHPVLGGHCRLGSGNEVIPHSFQP